MAAGSIQIAWDWAWRKGQSIFSAHKQVLVAGILFFVATAAFMWPTFSHPTTHSSGGDHMFNAWTLARNHHCLLHHNCPNYSDGNIFFPHQDTMLYSETQWSTGLLTLPLYFINQNPLFAANIWLLISSFGSGFFMYLLARYLSRGNQVISIMAGLVFEFAPTRITSMGHLQSMSIFLLPLIILLLLKYRDSGKRIFLAGFALTCSALFLASWYQMVFGLVVIGLFVLYVIATKASRLRGWWLAAAVILAIGTTLPLAKDYVRFSKANKATFSITNQIEFSASLNDYFIPYEKTVVGKLYYNLRPNVQHNSYNPDSYTYAGISLYIVMLICLSAIWWKRRGLSFGPAEKSLTVLLSLVFVVGFAMSLGPVIKIGNQFTHALDGIQVAVPAPYLLVDKFLPQLQFMRAIGRASVICLFALCCLLAVFAAGWNRKLSKPKRNLLITALVIVISIDLLPVKAILATPFQAGPSYKTNWSIPAVYKFIKNDESINNIIVLRTQKDYPGVVVPTAQAEDVLWAGFHNRNIFNGYSGFEPPEYHLQLPDFRDLQADDISKMKALGLRYVLIDKQLSEPQLTQAASYLLPHKLYEDPHYVLLRL